MVQGRYLFFIGLKIKDLWTTREKREVKKLNCTKHFMNNENERVQEKSYQYFDNRNNKQREKETWVVIVTYLVDFLLTSLILSIVALYSKPKIEKILINNLSNKIHFPFNLHTYAYQTFTRLPRHWGILLELMEMILRLQLTWQEISG